MQDLMDQITSVMHLKHAAETGTSMHQMKCLIDLSQSHIVSYVLIDLDFLHYIVEEENKVRSSAATKKKKKHLNIE